MEDQTTELERVGCFTNCCAEWVSSGSRTFNSVPDCRQSHAAYRRHPVRSLGMAFPAEQGPVARGAPHRPENDLLQDDRT